jgi:hypothetical protein
MAAVSKRDPVRSLANRAFLMISGRWFRAYSIVRHVGRTSGRAYQNPVSAYPLGDGFVIPVLYGTQSQWVRNAMAAGRFSHQGPRLPAGAAGAHCSRAGAGRLSDPVTQDHEVTTDPGLRVGAPRRAVGQASQRPPAIGAGWHSRRSSGSSPWPPATAALDTAALGLTVAARQSSSHHSRLASTTVARYFPTHLFVAVPSHC